MKKILFFILSLFLLANMHAQTGYSVFSNWSIGVSPVVTTSFKGGWDPQNNTNAGIGIMASKQLNERWAYRAILEAPGMIGKRNHYHYGKAIMGVQYGRNVYVFADGGISIGTKGFGWLGLNTEVGVGYQSVFNEKHKVFAELGGDATADLRDNLSTSCIFMRVGYMYSLGLTKRDRELDIQRALAQDAQDAYMISLVKNNREKTDSIDYLVHYIDSMHTSQMSTIDTIVVDMSGHLDSLISDIIENQDNYFAIPFSVEFSLNSSEVPANQMYRLENIAKMIIRDSTNTYVVCGYCDGTGSNEYNQTLSEKRADAVADILINQYGVPQEQIMVMGKGKEIEFGDIMSRINRRVSIYRLLE
jgi:outer membrane protein OmpA-like peptidoglycan-associated protein